MMMVDPVEAEALARLLHQGQRDKNGDPYIGHCARVAATVTTIEEKMVAWLHDTIEDCGVTVSVLEREYGIPADIVTAVDALTHREGEPRSFYFERVRSNPIALVVKRADVIDNCDPRRLLQLPAETMVRLMVKYAASLDELEAHGE